MTDAVKPTPEAIRQARTDNPKMRERDLAQQLQISEADLVAAYCGINVVRINPHIETFHMHLRTDHIAELWAVRKPTKDGHVTSLEAYGTEGDMIIQFFGKRHEGSGERGDWRQLVEALPRLMRAAA